MSAPTKERQEELLELVTYEISDRTWFDYHDWDGLIECDEAMTAEELCWLRENAIVSVCVSVVGGAV